jgi:zinc protease
MRTTLLPSRPARALIFLWAAGTLSLGLAPQGARAQAPAPAMQPPAAASLAPLRAVEGITEYRLPNGLQLLLAPDDSKPTTTVNLTVRVGNRHENYGETGMAHLLEHLIFKGSSRHPNAWAEFTRRGLSSNGSTWFDRTNYFASFAASDENLSWLIDWLGDALVNSFIARKDLDTEMTVVRNEMEMGENSPGRILYEKTLAAMYQWHNYGKSTIGARTDVEGVDIARLQAFYRTWYRPDNSTLIVSGRFEPARVLALVQEHFGRIPKPATELPRLYTLDAVQDGEREVTLRRAGGTPQMMATYHTVPGAHPDQAAAEVLALIMGEAPAGRLHKRLTEKGLAASTWAWTPALHDPGLIAFGAELAPGQDVAASRAALLATLESVATEPLTQEELDRARLRWLKSWEQVFNDPEQVGTGLSEWVALGDWRLVFLLRDRVRDLKLADLQRFASERLLPANRTLGVYLPTDRPLRAPAPTAVDVAQQMQAFKPQAALAQAESFDVAPANIDRRTERGRVGGLQFALLPKTTRGASVSATLLLRMGNLEALRGQGEVASVMAALLDKGGNGLSRQQVQDRLDALRTELSIGYRGGVLSVGLSSRRAHLVEAIELVTGLLRRPAFDAAVLEEVRREALTGLEQARQEPGALVSNALARHGNPYAPGDPRYAPTFDEQAQALRAVTLEAVQRLHAQLVGAGQAEFAAVGDFDAAAVRAALARNLAEWKAPVDYRRIESPLWAGAPARLVSRTPDKQNAVLQVRLPLPLDDSHADAPALRVANMILGQGGNSRLWVRLREKGGLSYDVGSRIDWNPREPHSVWRASAIFAPANLGAAETALREEVERALRDGFTEDEVRDARAALLRFAQLQRAQDASLAGSLASQLDLGRTMAWSAQLEEAISKVTREQAHAALKRYLKPEAFVTGIGGDFK